MNSDCVFCDRTQFEERLIAELPNFWIIATLGQITDGGYMLVVPKAHVLCIGVMEQQQVKTMSTLIDQVRTWIAVEYGVEQTTIFEHGIVGQTIQHAHLHIIPGEVYITEKVCDDFRLSHFTLHDSLELLRQKYEKQLKPYLLWQVGDDPIAVCWDPSAPKQYLRTVIAEALGRPERANWREMDKTLDRQLWSETVRRLKPYFA